MFEAHEPLRLGPTLCNPMDCSPPVSVHGILQARVLEWIAMPSSRRSSQRRDQTAVFCISCIAGRFFTHWATWGAQGLTQILSKRVLHLRGKPDGEVHACTGHLKVMCAEKTGSNPSITFAPWHYNSKRNQSRSFLESSHHFIYNFIPMTFSMSATELHLVFNA